MHSFVGDNASAEVGCLLAKTEWDKGYMQEALQVLIDYAGNELGIKVLYANIDSANAQTIKLFKKLNFSHQSGFIYKRQLWKNNCENRFLNN